jgi:hypothetical protein
MLADPVNLQRAFERGLKGMSWRILGRIAALAGISHRSDGIAVVAGRRRAADAPPHRLAVPSDALVSMMRNSACTDAASKNSLALWLRCAHQIKI